MAMDRCMASRRVEGRYKGKVVTCIAFGTAVPDPVAVQATCNELAAARFGVQDMFEGLTPYAPNSPGCVVDCTRDTTSYPCNQ